MKQIFHENDKKIKCKMAKKLSKTIDIMLETLKNAKKWVGITQKWPINESDKKRNNTECCEVA